VRAASNWSMCAGVAFDAASAAMMGSIALRDEHVLQCGLLAGDQDRQRVPQIGGSRVADDRTPFPPRSGS
jgi:hypothetical protein